MVGERRRDRGVVRCHAVGSAPRPQVHLVDRHGGAERRPCAAFGHPGLVAPPVGEVGDDRRVPGCTLGRERVRVGLLDDAAVSGDDAELVPVARPECRVGAAPDAAGHPVECTRVGIPAVGVTHQRDGARVRRPHGGSRPGPSIGVRAEGLMGLEEAALVEEVDVGLAQHRAPPRTARTTASAAATSGSVSSSSMRTREAARPVAMRRVGRAGDVLRIGFQPEVLDSHEEHAGAAAPEPVEEGEQRGALARRLGPGIPARRRAEQRVGEGRARPTPLGHRDRGGLRREHAHRHPGVDVGAGPVPRERRGVVGVETRDASGGRAPPAGVTRRDRPRTARRTSRARDGGRAPGPRWRTPCRGSRRRSSRRRARPRCRSSRTARPSGTGRTRRRRRPRRPGSTTDAGGP